MKKFLDNIDMAVSAAVLVFMTALTFANVVSRYFIHASIAFTEELTTSLAVLFSLSGAAIAAKRGSHLGLSILTDSLPPRLQRILGAAAYLLSAVFCGALAYYGFFMVQHEYLLKQLTPALKLPEWIYGSFIPIGSIFLCVRFLGGAIRTIRRREEHQ